MGAVARPAPGPRAARSPVPRRLARGLVAAREPLLIGLASRVLVLAAFVAIAAATAGGDGVWSRLVELVGSWDGTWYARIARFGYDPTLAHGNTPAFFPLWPLVLRGASAAVPGVPLAVLGSVLAQALFLAALCVCHRLVAGRLGPAAARRTALYIAFFPTSHVFSAVYSESLFLLLVAGAFALAEHRHLYGAAAVGVLATLTRPTGVLLAPALVVLLLERDGLPRSLADGWRLTRRALPLALLPAAFLGFQSYLAVRTGVPDAARLAQERGWGRGFTPLLVLQMPVAGIHATVDRLRGVASWPTVAYAWSATLWAWLVIWGAVRRPVPLAWTAFAAGVVVVPALAGSYMSFLRFGMAAFPFAVLLAILGAHVPWLHRALVVLLPVSLVATMAVTYGTGAFTP